MYRPHPKEPIIQLAQLLRTRTYTNSFKDSLHITLSNGIRAVMFFREHRLWVFFAKRPILVLWLKYYVAAAEHQRQSPWLVEKMFAHVADQKVSSSKTDCGREIENGYLRFEKF
jgi:hypothetical protein